MAEGIRYLSVCSGIEAATVAWHPLGWEPAAFSEIEKFPRAVLAHHYPDVPLHGDFTTIGADEYGPIDLLVGGTPCQSFSIAGLRGGLADDRGNLALEFLRLAQRTRPRWLVWENVPGVLSSDGGRDFGSILGGLVELGYGFAYRVLDAQFFGVAQRRRRVFVVGYLGSWARAAAVLFERHSLQGHPAPRREAGPGVAALTASGAGTCGADDNQGQAGHLISLDVLPAMTTRTGTGTGMDGMDEYCVAHSLRGEGFDASEDGTGRGTPLVPCWSVTQDSCPVSIEEMSPALKVGTGLDMGQPPCVAFDTTQITSAANYSNPKPGDPCHPLAAGAHPPAIASSAVRRLTPRECERLQGFPDDWTLIPWRGKPASECPDGPRYKALGNSMAVPVMRWIGERIAQAEAIPAAFIDTGNPGTWADAIAHSPCLAATEYHSARPLSADDSRPVPPDRRAAVNSFCPPHSTVNSREAQA